MSDRQVEARFNLKAVVQQTGIKPDTLRAWERRYGLPTPERSSGGHRLYSQDDVDTYKGRKRSPDGRPSETFFIRREMLVFGA